MSILIQHCRYAVRQLRQSPAFTFAAIITLALGIGATNTIFSLAYGILLRPLPFYKPEQLFAINEDLQSFGENEVVPASDVVMFERQMRSIRIAGFKLLNMELSGRGEPLETNVCRITGYMFPTLGVGPLLGRTFTQAEDEQSEPFAVLSYGF
jgi:putative ABC transport system permease protein